MNMARIDRQQVLERGVEALDLSVPEEVVARLLDFIEQLHKWNQAYNLTAVRDLDDMVVRHLLDSLAIAPYLVGRRILDIGTGAGLPGIPLALLFPEREFVLLDSNGKKVRFLQQMKGVMGLSNVTAVQARLPAYHPPEPFDTIVARALGEAAEVVSLCQHLLVLEGGRVLLMKGRAPVNELEKLDARYTLHRLQVPGLDAERHVVCVDR